MSDLRVEVIRSPRRRRTIEATLVDGQLRVHIPATLSKAEERQWVEDMKRRLLRRRDPARIDLAARARRLADRYDLPRPASIRWVDTKTRWGSCTPSSGAVRVAARLAEFPGWVLDYVIVHELAHLRVTSHSRRFYALADRYPLAERARGFLIAKGLEESTGDA